MKNKEELWKPTKSNEHHRTAKERQAEPRKSKEKQGYASRSKEKQRNTLKKQ